MKKAILGKKLGMSQVFTPEGIVIPVTVIEAGPCAVVQVKTKAKEGYDAVQVAFGEIKEKNVTKPLVGHYAKASAVAKRNLREFRFDDCSGYAVGDTIKCDSFVVGEKVNVTSKTRGRGFTGVIQRWNQSTGPMAHGSGFHRGVGSMSANSDPSRVFKNKHLPGHYGDEQVTIKNLVVVRIDESRNLLLIKGGIPGAKGSLVTIKA